ncbi:unnamed protein product [Enterobius vermicularis]|uniref:Ovule protein n=1 Tax=Enterobius vermicularis TaxID=51028 RepID=A0A0N4V113_ENTVE|nr:unnamed protein product [Enterobius vermicularis]
MLKILFNHIEANKHLDNLLSGIHKIGIKTTEDGDTDDFNETASRHSNVSVRSTSRSTVSYDSGFKSESEDISESVQKVYHPKGDIDFHKASTELLRTFRDFGNVDEGESLEKTLVAMEAELLKISLSTD